MAFASLKRFARTRYPVSSVSDRLRDPRRTCKLSLETQTLYAELLEQLTAFEARRSIGHVSGCFTTKTVKAETYYYFQYSEPGVPTRQVYVGKKEPVLEKVVDRYRAEREIIRADVNNISRLCAQLRAGGALVTDAASSRVLRALAASGVFHLNGVLVGTHAFIVLGNLLGLRWKSSSLRTQDVDIASERSMGIILPDIRADIPRALDQLEMGFLPVPELDPKNPSTSFKVRGKALRVDLLTPAIGPPAADPVFIPRFNAAAQPLRFLDLLLKNPVRGAIIDGGGILVNVPRPAIFAFHKLLTSQERAVSFHAKTDKDIMQAEGLFEVLVEERPGDILLAWDELRNRGKGLDRRLRSGLLALKKRYPDVHEKLAGLLNFQQVVHGQLTGLTS